MSENCSKNFFCRNYCRYDHNKLKDGLKNGDWSPVYISHSILDSLQEFNRVLTVFFDRHILSATERRNTNTSPWLTVDLKSEMDYRDVLQRKFRKLKTMENYEKYNRQRNRINNLVKRTKQKYNKNLLDESIKNTTSFGTTLKSIFTNKLKLKLTSTAFKVNKKVILNKETIVNGFDKFFPSIATTLLQSLHPIKDFVWNKPRNIPIRATPKFSFSFVSHHKKPVNV